MEPREDIPLVLNLSTPTRLGRTFSVALNGIKGQLVAVEADIGNTLPGFTLLGLPDKSLQEAKDRIRAAARNSQLPLTRRHLTVNLTPASLQKRGSHFDLAIIMAAWGADHAVREETGPVFLAALGLDGSLQTAPGLLPAVMAAVDAGHTDIIVAHAAAAQAKLVPGARIRAYHHVTEVARDFGAPIEQQAQRGPVTVTASPPVKQQPTPDMADIHGQHEARWALEIAAAGGHHLLLQGPPGAGKTMLAQRLPSILPAMDRVTALEQAAIRSLSDGQAPAADLPGSPPFEAPHHSASAVALIGGGSGIARPGSVSLAHGGVLFLDEAAEFNRQVLDTLRQPLETGQVVLHRARYTVEFPARFQLVLATNPCPCGYAGGAGKQCRCTSLQRRRYATKLSGPLLDRIDLQVAVQPVSARHLSANGSAEPSATIATRVRAAAERAASRLRPFGLAHNHEIPLQLFRQPALSIHPEGRRILDHALETQQITARGYAKILRVAWTITDLLQDTRPCAQHIDMALYLRLSPIGGQDG